MIEVQGAAVWAEPACLARDARDLLWFYLRGRQLADCVFLRRYRVGRALADFACLERRLCLIIDAGEPDVRERAVSVRARGFAVRQLEFARVFEDTESVLEEIGAALVENQESGR
ncbi:hypothetical protein BH24PSE2_BH24PSE2_07500 [soil metagenome]